MKIINILWIDDDFDSQNAARKQRIENIRAELEQYLSAKHDITPVILRCGDYEKSMMLLSKNNCDLIILDLQLSEMDRTATGFQVLVHLKKLKDNIPILLFSAYVPSTNSDSELEHESFEQELEQYEGDYTHAFPKDEKGIDKLCSWISRYVFNPPLSMLVMSDIHVDSDPAQKTISKNFRDSLLRDFKKSSKISSFDYLLICGDFSWRQQSHDLPISSSFINKMRNALDLNKSGQLQFCPGNHDIDLRPDSNPWEDYHQFVLRLSELEEELPIRFHAHRSDGTLGPFQNQNDMAYFYSDKQAFVDFISLNSVCLDQNKTVATIGDEQIRYLRTIPIKRNKTLRILILHHPLIQLVSEDDSNNIVFDGAKVVNYCLELGVDLVIHGHSHFSGIFESKITSINAIESEIKKDKELKFLSVPTLGGNPTNATPTRQYLTLLFSHLKANKQRDLSISSKIYNPQTEKWIDGEKILLKDFI